VFTIVVNSYYILSKKNNALSLEHRVAFSCPNLELLNKDTGFYKTCYKPCRRASCVCNWLCYA